MLKLGSPFTDSAVLQRDQFISIWGWTDVGSGKIVAELDGRKSRCKIGNDGYFLLRLSPHEAGGPYELTIRNESSGETIVLKDILVGEVWLCSGQSNMQYTLESNWGEANHSTQCAREAGRPAVCEEQLSQFREAVRKNGDRMRFFMVPMEATGAVELTCDATWEKLTPEFCGECSAVGAWFALKLHENLDVPIGLLFSAYGGTCVEAWTSRGTLMANPATADMVAEAEMRYADMDGDTPGDSQAAPKTNAVSLKYVEDSGNQGVTWGWANCDFDDSKWSDMQVPGTWIGQKISGNGVVWARLAVDVPPAWAGKDLTLRLGGVDKTDITYFNGQEVGRTGSGFSTEFWNIPRKYPVPGSLVKAGRNVIAVRMYSFAYDGSMSGVSKRYVLEGPNDETISLAGFWKACSEYDGGVVCVDATIVNGYGPGNPNTPAILFEGMIQPLLPYSLRGAIWYQGETNANHANEPYGYGQKVIDMIQDWRRGFWQPNLPLIQMELANYRAISCYNEKNVWPMLREEQRKACRMDNNVFLASAIDSGEEDDVHPQDKRTPGFRMAACALRNVYGMGNVVPNGPELVKAVFFRNTARLTFRFAEGMKLTDDPKKSFFVADINRIFAPADEVTVEGDTILISSKKYAYLRAVRYAWADNPMVCLYNGAGFPASAFRTDDWSLLE